ncbi:MAG TPA: hypothetical protein PLP17_13530, partial [Oligoflexia bacterium]|nr:hypothetical protein [Oligoflexia bacterium]
MLQTARQRRFFFYLLVSAAFAAASWNTFPVLDFSIYWQAARHLISGMNPYALPHPSTYVRYTTAETPHLLVWSNPLVLVPVIPFALLPLEHARELYLIFAFFVPLAASDIFCRAYIYHQPRMLRSLPALAVFFSPFLLACYAAFTGSMTPFALAALCVLFAWHAKHPFLAGAVFTVSLLRAHQLLPVYAAVLGYTLAYRRFRLIAGLSAGLLVSCAVVLAFQPQAFTMYLLMLRVDEAPRILTGITNASLPSALGHFFQL